MGQYGNSAENDRWQKKLERRVGCLLVWVIILAVLLVAAVVAGVLVFVFLVDNPESPKPEDLSDLEYLRSYRVAIEKNMSKLEGSLEQQNMKINQLETSLNGGNIALRTHAVHSAPRGRPYSVPFDDEDSVEWQVGTGSGTRQNDSVYFDERRSSSEEDLDYYYDDLEYDDLDSGSGFSSEEITYDDEPNCIKFSRPICPTECFKEEIDSRGCPVPVCC